MLIGLTGQMGVGKTTLAAHLHSHGARIIDADGIGHEILERPTVKRRLQQSFGEHVVQPDGTVDRRSLAKQAFKSSYAVSQLNEIVGEPLSAELWNRVGDARGTADETVVVDAALLIEWGMQERFDAIVVVTVEEEKTLIGRLESDRGLERGDILRRLSVQGPVEDKLVTADFIVHNDGNREALEKRAGGLWHDLENLRERMKTSRTSPSTGDR